MNRAPASSSLRVLARRSRALWLAAATLLAACAAPAPQPAVAPADAERVARELVAAGRLAEAGAEYRRLALAAGPDAAAGYRLKAAAAYIDGEQFDAATAELEILARIQMPPRAAAYRDLLRAEMLLHAERPEEALEFLAPDTAAQFAGSALERYLRLRIAAHNATGHHLAEAQDRVALDPLLDDIDAVGRNRQAIWLALGALTPATLERARSATTDPGLAGWLDLATAAATSVTHPASLQRMLEDWRARYPGHPADAEITPQLVLSSSVQATPPSRVALLLPLHGRFARAASAVRDGFLAAWYADAGSDTRPSVRIVDTADKDLWSTYAAAVDDGARVVIGPLQRDSVDALARSESRLVPTLALNRATVEVRPDRSAPLYQFALSPEDEARAVAERAWFDGRARALVLYPDNDWGRRVRRAFTNAFEELGGTVRASAGYDPTASDMSAPVAEVLGVSASEQRNRALRRRLGTALGFESRRRQDVDMVVLAAFPQPGRQIRPQLQFHKAGDLPVYATSHVFTGHADAAHDRDLDGVSFGDMPWALPETAVLDPLRQQVAAALPAADDAFVRLYAFGADAYRLMPHLGRLRAQRSAEIEGATGRLSVDAGARVHRRLVWARFRDGLPRVIPAAVAVQ